MISYTDVDKDLLMRSILDKHGRHNSEYGEYTFIELYGAPLQISLNRLITFTFYNGPLGYFRSFDEHLKKFWFLIHYIPLKRVPLYLNTIPDVANWRLKIGR
jgi:hypothetical protein